MNNYVDLPIEGGAGGGVSSLNNLTGALTLVAGTGITITPAGSTILIGSTTSGGTVTSVGLADSTGLFNVTGSPVTTAGVLTLASFKSQAANTFLAAPNGSSGAPTFRTIVPADVPTLNQNTTGTAGNITATSNSTLVTLSSLSLPYSQVTGGPTGSVSSVSVVSANGLAGTVANPTTTPAITLSTTVSGILFGNGTSITAAVAGNFPTLNQNTTGTAANVTATSNSTLTTLSALSLPTSQLSGSVSLTTQVTGVLPIANGGTGQSTANAALNALLPSQTGNAGEVLSTNGTNTMWIAAGGTGTVTSVGLADSTGLFNVTGSPVTTAGTLTLASFKSQAANTFLAAPSGSSGAPTFRGIAVGDVPTLNQNTTGTAANVTGVVAVANGGTGQTSYTNGQILIGNTTGNTLVPATLTAGTGITVVNGAGAITLSVSSQTASSTKTSNYTLLTSDSTIFADTSGGAFTITMPSPTGNAGRLYRIIDSTGFWATNNLTLAPNSTEMIEGIAGNKVIQTAWDFLTITTEGTNWFVG